MTKELRQGLIGKQHLMEEDIAEVRALALSCEREEQLHMRVGGLLIQHGDVQETNSFFCYRDDRLVGYLGMENGGAAHEIVIMVDPTYRKRGIASLLLDIAFAECRTRGQRYLILVCERKSRSGQSFVHALDATYSESEHEMWLAPVDRPYPSKDEHLVIRPALSTDLDMLATTQSESFGDDIAYTRERIQSHLQEDSHYYLALYQEPAADREEPVGLCRLDDQGSSAGIYSFGVRPAFQGRGYGRQILVEMIRLLHGQGQQRIMLDVETNNTRALNLYRSVGFTIYATYDYYILAI